MSGIRKVISRFALGAVLGLGALSLSAPEAAARDYRHGHYGHQSYGNGYHGHGGHHSYRGGHRDHGGHGYYGRSPYRYYNRYFDFYRPRHHYDWPHGGYHHYRG